MWDSCCAVWAGFGSEHRPHHWRSSEAVLTTPVQCLHPSAPVHGWPLHILTQAVDPGNTGHIRESCDPSSGPSAGTAAPAGSSHQSLGCWLVAVVTDAFPNSLLFPIQTPQNCSLLMHGAALTLPHLETIRKQQCRTCQHSNCFSKAQSQPKPTPFYCQHSPARICLVKNSLLWKKETPSWQDCCKSHFWAHPALHLLCNHRPPLLIPSQNQPQFAWTLLSAVTAEHTTASVRDLYSPQHSSNITLHP